MSINPGFVWSDVVAALNDFLGQAPVAGLLVAVAGIGVARMIIGVVRGMFE